MKRYTVYYTKEGLNNSINVFASTILDAKNEAKYFISKDIKIIEVIQIG